MHGLILAGGEGSRFAAEGIATPKALIPIGGVPQLLRLARTLDRLGCASLTCLVRDGVDLAPIAADLRRLRVPLALRSCITPSSLHTLALGLEVVPHGPVFCAMVDTLIPAPDWARLYDGSRRALARGADAVLVVTPFVDDERPLFVALDDRDRVCRVGAEAGDPVLVTGGVYVLSDRIRATAAEAIAAGRSRVRAWLGRLVQAGCDVQVVEVPKIIDLDRRRDLEAARAWQDFCEDGGAPMG